MNAREHNWINRSYDGLINCIHMWSRRQSISDIRYIFSPKFKHYWGMAKICNDRMCCSRVHRLSAQKMCGQSRIKHPFNVYCVKQYLPPCILCAEALKNERKMEKMLSRGGTKEIHCERNQEEERNTKSIYIYPGKQRGYLHKCHVGVTEKLENLHQWDARGVILVT